MFILLICTLVSVWLFGLYVIVRVEEHQKKLQIHEKLIESVEKQHQDLMNDLHTL